MPGLLGGLWSDSKKVRKKIIKCFDIALEKPVSRAKYTPLAKAIVNNKASILATSENLPEVIEAFAQETRSSNTILLALLDEAIKCDELLVRMGPIFAFLDKNGLIQLALHATTLLAGISLVKSKQNALESILANIGSALAKNLGEPSIWEFFLNGIKSQSADLVQHNGMKKLIACAVMDTISDYCTSEKIEPSYGKELLKTLLELSRCSKYFPFYQKVMFSYQLLDRIFFIAPFYIQI